MAHRMLRFADVRRLIHARPHAIVLLAALLAASASPALADRGAHAACPATHHHCSQVGRISAACCRGANHANTGTPGLVKQPVRAGRTIVPLATAWAPPALAWRLVHLPLLPPRLAHRDLGLLFGTLLI
jgi:hypothetical protein